MLNVIVVLWFHFPGCEFLRKNGDLEAYLAITKRCVGASFFSFQAMEFTNECAHEYAHPSNANLANFFSCLIERETYLLNSKHSMSAAAVHGTKIDNGEEDVIAQPISYPRGLKSASVMLENHLRGAENRSLRGIRNSLDAILLGISILVVCILITVVTFDLDVT